MASARNAYCTYTVHIITNLLSHVLMYACTSVDMFGFILHAIFVVIICDVVMGALLP